jgi:hypothetical protein
LAASLYAGLVLGGWIAIGSLFLRERPESRTDHHVAAVMVIGAALTSFALAILTRQGIVTLAVAFTGILALVAIAARWTFVVAAVRDVSASIRVAGRGAYGGRWMIGALAALLWLMAIAPPREGDVMHYHLAHIRQIVRDGQWLAIPDPLYAIPFGWSLNFLPFEASGLPQAAGVVSFGLWWIVLALLAKTLNETLPGRLSLPLCLLFLGHPFVLKVFSSALSDAYGVLLVTLVVLLLRRLEQLDQRAVCLLGFAAWIGAQSRYQLVAVSISVSLIVAFALARSGRWKSLGSYLAGSGFALLLASPFYLANLESFGNPVWPLFAGGSDSASYVDTVAAQVMSTMKLPFEFDTFRVTLPALVMNPALFPLPLVLIGFILAGCFMTRGGDRKVAAFGALFLVLWTVMTPRLYPTHLLPLLPLGPVLLASLVSRWNSIGREPLLSRLATAGVAASIVFGIAFSWDHVRYALTGDAAVYHRFTWYYPVYQWANQHTPRSSRFLAIVQGGQTYYLDREYRAANPFLSAEVDWRTVQSGEELGVILGKGEYDYVIYDDRDWSAHPGGSQMQSSIRSATSTGILVPVFRSRERLYTSRIPRRAITSDVVIFQAHPVETAPHTAPK